MKQLCTGQITELLWERPLTDFDGAELTQDGDRLCRLQDQNIAITQPTTTF
jgi:hypothetical protein